MHNQHETTTNNLVKIIGLGLVMLMLLFAFFFNKGNTNPFGLPIDRIENVDSTKTN